VLILVVAQAAFVIAALIKQDNIEDYLGKKFSEMDCKDRQSIESDSKCCGWNETLPATATCPCGYKSSKVDVLLASYEAAGKQRGVNLPAAYTELNTLEEAPKQVLEEDLSQASDSLFTFYNPLDSVSVDHLNSRDLALQADNTTYCSKQVSNVVQNHLLLVGVLGAILVVCQLAALVFSCCMCQEIRNVPSERDEDMPLISEARKHREHHHSDRSDSRISAREDEYAF
jgi:Tetraspanin family